MRQSHAKLRKSSARKSRPRSPEPAVGLEGRPHLGDPVPGNSPERSQTPTVKGLNTTRAARLDRSAPEPHSPPKQGQDLRHRFPIVGIGASAGGLEAFTELLHHLPSDTGMAFVV